MEDQSRQNHSLWLSSWVRINTINIIFLKRFEFLIYDLAHVCIEEEQCVSHIMAC